MSTETDRFDSTLTAEEVLDGFEALVNEKGWKLKERSEDEATAGKGLSVRTFGDEIEVTADEVEGGTTRVHVVVHSRQIVDWGSNDEIAAAIRTRLSGAAAT